MAKNHNDENNIVDADVVGEESQDSQKTTNSELDLKVKTFGQEKFDMQKARDSQFLPEISEERRKQLRDEADALVGNLENISPNSTEFQSIVAKVRDIGQEDVFRVTSNNTRMLDRATSSLKGSKKSGGEASIGIADSLNSLRTKMNQLDPNHAHKGIRRYIAMIPGGSRWVENMQQNDTAREQLESILSTINAGRDILLEDEQDLSKQQEEQWESLLKLDQALEKTSIINERIQLAIESSESRGEVELADAYRKDIQFAATQRHQDIMAQMVVTGQAFLSMGMVRSINHQLIDAVERAKNVTIPALETSVVIAQALDSQDRTVDAIKTLSKDTESIITRNSQRISKNVTRSYEQASQSGVSPQVMKDSLATVVRAGQELDTVRLRELGKMDRTLEQMREVYEEAMPQLDRMKNQQDGYKI